MSAPIDTRSTTSRSGMRMRATAPAPAGDHEEWNRFHHDEHGEEHRERRHDVGQAGCPGSPGTAPGEGVALAPGVTTGEQGDECEHRADDYQDEPERRVGRRLAPSEECELLAHQLGGEVASHEVDAPGAGAQEQAS